MDAIEYAIGDVTTEWGAKRAEQGHPEPFPLQYVEIGNENWGDEYDKRFDIFAELQHFVIAETVRATSVWVASIAWETLHRRVR